MRVIIPAKFRERLLNDLHEVHPGMSSMKSLARSYIWWPSIDQDIEDKVRGCGICLALRKSPPASPLIPWKWPKRVWQRLHIDFAEFQRRHFLIVIDSFSKWLEVFHMTSTTSRKTIETLRTLFASYGLPEDVVSDNGPQFISYEFKDFLSKNGVRQILTPPYHPASNGAAERSVQTVKQGLLKQIMEGHTNQTLQHRLDNFLLTYRITPHTVTGCAPSELFLKRQIRNRFTLLKPNLEQTVTHKQELQAKNHDSRVRVRSFEVGQFVQVKNFQGDINRWLPGRITKKLGLQTFLVRTGGKIRYCHIDHLLPGNDTVDSNGNSPTDTEIDITSSKPLVPDYGPDLLLPNLSNTACTSSTTSTQATSIDTPTSPVKPVDTKQRYPQRVRKPPEKLTM
ncbi:uncharacterized protein K02A2.6-like [Patella vulgata]|uniref:uncharacterized protein K02A2.6-like n=1 Tax=Patella vulgata TaxID=6465 RepID=UPI0024A84FB3|nr:uncharacterized protein K02A2.6-like [Patella vulgata]